jgi:hypothetical protein
VGAGVGTAWMAPPQRFSPAPGRVTQPELAEGRSAGCSDSLQLPLLFLKAGPAGGRLRLPSSAGSTTTPGTRNRDAADRPLVAQGIA